MQADANFLYDKTAMLNDRIKETPCIVFLHYLFLKHLKINLMKHEMVRFKYASTVD
jgi:hypothetical protein